MRGGDLGFRGSGEGFRFSRQGYWLAGEDFKLSGYRCRDSGLSRTSGFRAQVVSWGWCCRAGAGAGAGWAGLGWAGWAARWAGLGWVAGLSWVVGRANSTKPKIEQKHHKPLFDPIRLRADFADFAR